MGEEVGRVREKLGSGYSNHNILYKNESILHYTTLDLFPQTSTGQQYLLH